MAKSEKAGRERPAVTRWAAHAAIAMSLVIAASRAGAATTPEMDALVKAAQQEGSVVVDAAPVDLAREAVTKAFAAKYGIPVSYISSGSSKSAARVRAERAAGRYLLDVFVTGSDTPLFSFLPGGWLDPIEPALIDPDVTDPAKWRDGHLWFVDPKRYILRVLAYVTPSVAVDTDLVKPGRLTSFAGLLDPQWQGKIIAKDPTVSGAGASLISYFYLNFGPEFVQKLYVGQKPFVSRDSRQSAQSLAQGSYAIWVGPDVNEASKFKALGYPIDYVEPTDGPGIISGGWGFVCLMNKPPHPNAAKLFVNWIASQDGQEAYARALASMSLRTDLRQDWVEDISVPRDGKKYLDTFDYTFITEQRDAAFAKVQKLLGF